MAELTNLVARRGVLKAQLTRLKHFVDTIPAEITDEIWAQIRVRQNKLDSLWQSFEKVQIDIDILSEDIEAQTAERTNFETGYFAVAARLQVLTDKSHNNRSSSGNVSVSSPQISDIRLPVIELPRFDGKFNTWVEFRAS